MELLGDMGHVESHFFPLEMQDIVSMQDMSNFALNVPSSSKSFWRHPMVLLGEEAQVEPRFSLFGGSANLDAR